MAHSTRSSLARVSSKSTAASLNYAEIVRRLGRVDDFLSRHVDNYLKWLEDCASLLEAGKTNSEREKNRRHCVNRSTHFASMTALLGSTQDCLNPLICDLDKDDMWRERDASTAVVVAVLRYLLTDYADNVAAGKLVDDRPLPPDVANRIVKAAKALLPCLQRENWTLDPERAEALGL